MIYNPKNINNFLNTPKMFVSSDNSTVVIDIGTETYKIGYSNIEYPTYYGTTENYDTNFISPVFQSTIQNIENYIKIIDKNIPFDTCYLLISENTFECEESKEEILTHIMENNKASSVIFSKSAILDTFSYGKTTAINISIGCGSTQISSVIDGYISMRKKIDYGCIDITNKFMSKIEKQTGFPNFCNVSNENQVLYKKREYARSIKEDFYKKWSETIKYYNEESVDHLNMKRQFDNMHKNILEIINCISEIIEKSPNNKKQQLLNNILISGGGSFIVNINTIIEKSINEIYPNEKVCVFNNPSNFHTFTGGVVMSNIGSFKSLNIGRLDYKEYGTSIFKRKNQSWVIY